MNATAGTRAHRPTLACLANGRSCFATNAGAVGHGKHGPNAPSDNPRAARCWNGPVRDVEGGGDQNLKTCGDHTPTSGFVARVDSASQWSHAAGSSRHAAHNVTLLTGQPNQRGLGDLFWVNGVPSLSTLQILRAVGKQQCMVACPHCHHAVISGTALP